MEENKNNRKVKNKKKKTLLVVFVLIILLIIVGCFLIFGKNLKDYTSDLPNPDDNPILKSLREEVILDNSIVGLSNYSSQLYGMIRATDAIVAENSEESDSLIASNIENLDAYMSIYKDYDSYVKSLDNNTYKDLKSTWKKFVTDAKNLYNTIKAGKYTKGDNFIKDDNFEKEFNSLTDEITKFVNNSNNDNTNAETSSSENTESNSEESANESTNETIEEQSSEENSAE